MKTFAEYSAVELVDLIELIDKLHNTDKVSLREISRMLGTYPVKILRFCRKHNIGTLSKAESLRAAYASGRVVSALTGTTRTEEEKAKIAESQYKFWQGMSQEERAKRGRVQSEIFAKRTDKVEFARKGQKAIRRAADEGSKLEKKLIEYFIANNIKFRHHDTSLFGSTKLEADFFLPELNIVIEADGPSHFSANFGIENYAGQMKADEKKNGLVLSLGASIMRLQHEKTLYDRDYKKLFELLDSTLDTLDNEIRIVNVKNI